VILYSGFLFFEGPVVLDGPIDGVRKGVGVEFFGDLRDVELHQRQNWVGDGSKQDVYGDAKKGEVQNIPGI